MLKGHRTTVSVDIFSMGCIYYFVLTKGAHPFGDYLKRQANILSNEYDLKKLNCLTNQNVLAESLIRDMINQNSDYRPDAESIKNHPFFWKEDRILMFLQDVSDRIEKLDFKLDPLKTLERNAKYVVRNDWNLHLDSEITSDLRKYRDYQGTSVRDLLRALRNKKHHYHELSSHMQKVLGTIPTDFTHYWVDKFPHLLLHSYHALELCASENIFKSYYSTTFSFTKPDYLTDENYDNLELIQAHENAKLLAKNSKKDYKAKQYANKNGNFTDNRSAYTNRRNENQYTSSPKPNKRGMYNFFNNQNGNDSEPAFITRDQMMPLSNNLDTSCDNNSDKFKQK
jgi:serine/threonine-protein kinase/endoribonuclease IRE1